MLCYLWAAIKPASVCEHATKNLILSTRDIPILQNLGKNGSFRELFQSGLSQALGSPRRAYDGHVAEHFQQFPSGLEGLGMYFAELATLCDSAWTSFVKTVTARIRSGRIEAITTPLHRFGKSSPVRQQLQRCRDRLIQDLVNNPTAIAEFGSDITQSRQFVSLFGQMCRTWPALRDCALRKADRLLQSGRNMAKAP